MATQNHEYPVRVNWTGGRDGRGNVTPAYSKTEIPLAVPPEFNGVGGASNPEELLTSAIAGCYSITYGIVAATRRIPVAGLVVDAVGTVEQNGPNFTYKQIIIRPTIKLGDGATEDQEKLALDMAHKADAYCIVTNAVRGKVEVVIEPTVER